MKLPKTANVIDIEHDNYNIIEIGITTLSLDTLEIVQTYSLPIKTEVLSDKIAKLTGWTIAKLQKQGISLDNAKKRLLKYGIKNRLLITDTSNEIEFLQNALGLSIAPPCQNVAALFSLLTELPINLGLAEMLKHFGLEPDGRPHRASDDSKNIARLFAHVVRRIRHHEKWHAYTEPRLYT